MSSKIFVYEEPDISVISSADSSLRVVDDTQSITIYEEPEPQLELVSAINSPLRLFEETQVITLFEPGPRGAKGDKGDRGETGFSGAGEPFFVITSGSLYATTASLAIFAGFSSSLSPYTSNTPFDLGSTNNSWRNVYVSESIFIVKNGVNLVSIRGSENTVEIGQSRITTSSFGFSNSTVINRLANNQQTFLIQSASISTSFNSDGVFVLPDFQYLPTLAIGGLIKSGSNLFFGI